jgi:hypothetical protein
MAKSVKYRYRSAVTGKWVNEAYNKRYPHKCVREKLKPTRKC